MIRVTVEVLPNDDIAARAVKPSKHVVTISNVTGNGEAADYVVHVDPPVPNGRNASIVRGYIRKRGMFSLVGEALVSLGLTEVY